MQVDEPALIPASAASFNARAAGVVPTVPQSQGSRLAQGGHGGNGSGGGSGSGISRGSEGRLAGLGANPAAVSNRVGSASALMDKVDKGASAIGGGGSSSTSGSVSGKGTISRVCGYLRNKMAF